MEEVMCSDCKRLTVMVTDYGCGDTICTECGLVVDPYFIDETPPWRISPDDCQNERPVNPTNPFLKTSTVIEKVPQENASSVVSNDESTTFHRRETLLAKIPNDDLIEEARKEIGRMTDALQLDIVIKFRACEIISKFVGKSLQRGKKLNALCAASVSTACRELQLSRTLKEISTVAKDVELKHIRKASLEIKGLLGSDQDEVASGSAPHGIINTGELVRRFCSKLDLGQREIQAVQEAVQEAEKFDIRRNPKSILASIIFMISHISQTKQRPIEEIGIVAEVLEITIKNSVRDMYPYALKIIPKWYACEEDIIKTLGGTIDLWDSARYKKKDN